jgi:hypothetical protein
MLIQFKIFKKLKYFIIIKKLKKKYNFKIEYIPNLLTQFNISKKKKSKHIFFKLTKYKYRPHLNYFVDDYFFRKMNTYIYIFY